MGQIGRGVILAVGLAGGTLFSQAPEFAQQYRQRIGGAIDELRIIVDDFTKQAADHHLDRQQALDVYARSPDDFLRDRGLSMAGQAPAGLKLPPFVACWLKTYFFSQTLTSGGRLVTSKLS